MFIQNCISAFHALFSFSTSFLFFFVPLFFRIHRSGSDDDDNDDDDKEDEDEDDGDC